MGGGVHQFFSGFLYCVVNQKSRYIIGPFMFKYLNLCNLLYLHALNIDKSCRIMLDVEYVVNMDKLNEHIFYI